MHHVAVLRPAIHADANTAPSCINIKLKMEQTKLKQHRKCKGKHAFELKQAAGHPAEQLPT